MQMYYCNLYDGIFGLFATLWQNTKDVETFPGPVTLLVISGGMTPRCVGFGAEHHPSVHPPASASRKEGWKLGGLGGSQFGVPKIGWVAPSGTPGGSGRSNPPTHRPCHQS